MGLDKRIEIEGGFFFFRDQWNQIANSESCYNKEEPQNTISGRDSIMHDEVA